MKQKELGQKILAMYHSLSSEEEKKQFVHLLKDVIKIIETMSSDDFAKFVDDFEEHLNNLDKLKNEVEIKN